MSRWILNVASTFLAMSVTLGANAAEGDLGPCHDKFSRLLEFSLDEGETWLRRSETLYTRRD